MPAPMSGFFFTCLLIVLYGYPDQQKILIYCGSLGDRQ